jgi:hypothetical protein
MNLFYLFRNYEQKDVAHQIMYDVRVLAWVLLDRPANRFGG